MSAGLPRFHIVGTADFPGSAHVSFLGSTGGEPVGIADTRFPSPGWLLRKSWPDLRYNLPHASPSLLTGERLTPELAARLQPIRVELRAPLAAKRAFPEQLPPWIIVAGVPVISARAMEAIDALEPGRHQFFPVRFEAWDTQETLYTDERYGYLNVLNWIAPDALYDLEAMGGPPAGVQSEVRMGSDAADGFSAPVMSTNISLDKHVFSNWLVRADWISAGHLMSTGSYSKTRFIRVSAESLVFVSDALLDGLVHHLPPGAIKTRAIEVSRR